MTNNRATIRAFFHRLAQRTNAALSLNGRLHVAQPWAVAIGPALLLLGLIAAYRWLFFVAYALLLLTAAAYAWVRVVGPRVALRRRLRGAWAQVGDELEEEWLLINNAALPLLWLDIEDDSTLPQYHGRRVVSAGIGEQTTWTTSAVCTQRGVYTLGPLTARLGDPFGLFRYEWREVATEQIVVYPPLVQLPPLVMPQGQRGGLARADLLQQYATPSVGGLRPYAPGDLLSHIHWPTVARTGTMMVKEFDQERAGALWIVLDLAASAYADQALGVTGQGLGMQDTAQPITLNEQPYGQTSVASARAAVNTSATALELAVVLACSLAAQALSEGRSVGLLADDGRQRLLTPGRGPRQLWRILGALVDVQATGTLPLGELLRQGGAARAGDVSGAALVVVTPALDGAWLPALASWLRGRAGGALALLVAAQQAQGEALKAQLATGGIVAQTFVVGAPLALLHPPKQRATARVSPLGRVRHEG